MDSERIYLRYTLTFSEGRIPESAGGCPTFGTELSDAIVAFALPEEPLDQVGESSISR